MTWFPCISSCALSGLCSRPYYTWASRTPPDAPWGHSILQGTLVTLALSQKLALTVKLAASRLRPRGPRTNGWLNGAFLGMILLALSTFLSSNYAAQHGIHVRRTARDNLIALVVSTPGITSGNAGSDISTARRTGIPIDSHNH